MCSVAQACANWCTQAHIIAETLDAQNESAAGQQPRCRASDSDIAGGACDQAASPYAIRWTHRGQKSI